MMPWSWASSIEEGGLPDEWPWADMLALPERLIARDYSISLSL